MHKRGLSVVVSTVLIVLLVVAGISILWSFVKKGIDENTVGGKEDCFTLDLEPIECGYAVAGSWCVLNPNFGTITQVDIYNSLAYAVIKRNEGEGDLKSAKLVFTDEFGNVASEDLTDLNIPELKLKFKKDLSGMLELETNDVAIESDLAFVPVKVEVAPIVGNNLLCEPYTGYFPCNNLESNNLLYRVGSIGTSCPSTWPSSP
jgi:hypothetical protein